MSPSCHSVISVSEQSQQIRVKPILFPEPANFLWCMLDENEGSGKDQFLGDPDWSSEMQNSTISPLFADY